jgi:hypothetical protein
MKWIIKILTAILEQHHEFERWDVRRYNNYKNK